MNRDLLLKNVHLLQSVTNEIGLGSRHSERVRTCESASVSARFELFITNDELRSCTEALFRDGHYKQAVEAAFICVEQHVRSRSGLDESGVKLMNKAFSKENPTLKLNRLRSQSENDEQDGYRFLFSGAMAGIRNPRAHTHNLKDDPDAALEMLALANHLLRALGKCTKARQSRTKRSN